MALDPAVPEIDVHALASKRLAGVPLVDVRNHEEFAEVHAPGAKLIPLPVVADRLGDFPTDTTVYVICRSGARSFRACEFLRANGVDAVNVAGGTLAWLDAGQPVETGIHGH
jgi:rhodanese-related sulfurtransferase